jgi:hypothetical protein
MKRRQSRGNTLIAGLAGAGLVVAVSLGLNLAAFSGQGQAQDEQPILPTIAMTATPTVPPLPTAGPALGSSVLVRPAFESAAALASWEFVDVGVPAGFAEGRSVWAVADGALVQDRTAAAGNPNFYDTMAFTGEPAWSDYTVSARFYDEGNGNAGLVARRQGDSFYRFRMLADTFSDTPKLVIEKVVDGQVTVLASRPGPGYGLRTWNTMAFTVTGGRLQATLNDTVVLEAEDAALTAGQPGLFTTAMGNIRFGDVVVAGKP